MNTFKKKILFILLIISLILIAVILFLILEEYNDSNNLYIANIATLGSLIISASLLAYGLYRTEQEVTH